MKSNFVKKYKYLIIFGVLFSISLVSGVGFHVADEIMSGTFNGDFVFDGSLSINDMEDCNKIGTDSNGELFCDNSTIIEVRDSNPPSPVEGQMWLIK